MTKESELLALAALYRRVTKATDELDARVIHANAVIQKLRSGTILRPLRQIALRD